MGKLVETCVIFEGGSHVVLSFLECRMTVS
jgi:hypothetical protein